MEFNLDKIVQYMNNLGFTSYGSRKIKPEQCTGGKGCEVYYKGLKFYVYINKKNIKKIGENTFNCNNDAYKIIRKMARLANCFGVYTLDKRNKVRIIDKDGNIVKKRLPKLNAKYRYSNILFDSRAEAEDFANKLLITNGVSCSVTNMVNYWNKTIQDN